MSTAATPSGGDDREPRGRDAATTGTATRPDYDDGARRDDRDPIAREKERFGGMHFFLAFFGWLTATGMVVLLTAILTTILGAIGLQNSAPNATSGSGSQIAAAIGVATVAGILFVAYYCGGYVAGRMARFSGAKQGLAVWLWALVIAILAAIAGAVAGSATGAFAQLNTNSLHLSNAAGLVGIVTAIVAVLFSLGGALLGGIGGVRYHRKVDRVGLGA